MAEKIRKADKKDFEPLMRFLEKSYGARRNFFSENYGYLLDDVFGADDDAPKGSYIIEKNGEIISHVGLYPLDLVSGGVKITAGGIGNVATHPGERGKGFMGKLLMRAVRDMRVGGVVISVLWGDRRRYGNFGWETAGEKFNFTFTSRSFEKSGVERARDIEEVEPESAAGELRRFPGNTLFRAERGKKLSGIISRNSNRLWLSKDGYLCGMDAGGLAVNEVFSVSGNEAGMILSAMEWAGRDKASTDVSPYDGPLLAKLLPAAESWMSIPEGMFRVNSWRGLLDVFSPLLEERAVRKNLGGFNIPLEIDAADGKEKIGIALHKGKIRIIAGPASAAPVRMSGEDAARLFLGGPCPYREELEPVRALLPLPLHIPELDRV